MNNITLPNEFLEIAVAELAAGRKVRLRADGESMYPYIRGGRDDVEVSPLENPAAMPLYAIALFRHNGAYKIHRYIGINDGRYLFMGDGNYSTKEIVEATDIAGIVTRIFKPDGHICEPLSPKNLAKGRRWVRLQPLRRFILPVLRRRPARYGGTIPLIQSHRPQ